MAKKTVKNTFIKLNDGAKYPMTPNGTSVELVGYGRSFYLWIGNNALNNGWCFATLSGEATLRKLATEILSRLDGKNKPTSRRITKVRRAARKGAPD